MDPNSEPPDSHSKKLFLIVGVAILVIIAAALVILAGRHKSSQIGPVTAGTKCLSRQFAVGSSGDCVRDIQTMVNFMETDGLTQCPFPGAASLPVDGHYDTQTAAQVTVVQKWLTCFDKEEGITPPQFTAGTVTDTTWSELCTYAYAYPSRNNDTRSPYHSQTLVAGRDAGCADLASE